MRSRWNGMATKMNLRNFSQCIIIWNNNSIIIYEYVYTQIFTSRNQFYDLGIHALINPKIQLLVYYTLKINFRFLIRECRCLVQAVIYYYWRNKHELQTTKIESNLNIPGISGSLNPVLGWRFQIFRVNMHVGLHVADAEE